jgi:hypothetical protein
MRRSDAIDGLLRRCNSMLRTKKFSDAVQEFVDEGCEVEWNGNPIGVGKGKLKSSLEKLNELLGIDGKLDLAHFVVGDDNQTYCRWLLSGQSSFSAVINIEWDQNKAVAIRAFGAI